MRDPGVEKHQELLAAMMSTMAEGAIIQNASGRIEACNESALRILGLTEDQLAGQPSIDPRGRAIHEDGTPFPSETHPAMATLRSGQPASGVTMGIYRPDGSLRWISINSRCILHEDKPVAAISTFTDVTRRNQAAEAGWGEDRLYREMFERAVEGMYRTSPEGRCLAANPALAQILGYDSGEEVTAAISDSKHQVWVDPEERREFQERLESQGVVLRHECQFKRRDGTPIWVSLDARKVCSADGKTLWYEGFLQDISERKRAQIAVQDSERKFAAMFRFCPAAVSLADVASGFRFVDVNDYFELTTGYMRSEVIGRTGPELGIWPNPAEFSEAVRRMHDDGRIRDFEFHFRRKDGAIRNGMISAESVELGGRPFVIAATDDITELRQAEEAVRKSNQQFLSLVNCVPDTIWTIDLNGNFTFVSPRVQRTHGWKSEEVLNMNFRQMVTPEQVVKDNKILAEELARASSPAYDRRSLIRLESEELCKDGSTFWAEISASLLWSDDGLPIGVIGATRDVTERKRAESELKRYRDDLEEVVRQRTEELQVARDLAVAANQAKSAFLAHMSHELRTPLNAILGFARLIQENESVSADQRARARIISRSGENLLELINELLDMAKIEAGATVLRKAPVDLHELAHWILDLMRIRAQEKGLELLLERAPNVPQFVRTDAPKLRQIFLNLVGNAIKFTESGRVTVRLNAVAEEPRSLLRLEVEDTGVGIPAEDQDKIFRPFIQLIDASTGGTGLGLSITRRYVDLLGGAITLESETGRGSCFRVELPVEITERGAGSEAPMEPQRGVGRVAGGIEWRILVAEDEEDNRTLMQQLLEEAGFQVRVAVNGEETVEKFRLWRPHFIWMDWRMPGMDGAQATECIRGMEGGGEVRIAAVTADAFSGQHAEILASGVDDMIHKPFRREELFECMARLLGVQFVYDKTPPQQQPPQSASSLQLSRDALLVLPEPLRKELADAVVSLDLDRIGHVIRRVSELDAGLGATMDRLARRLALTPILAALRALEQTS